MDTNTKSQLNFLAKPAIILGLVILLLFVVFSFGFRQINNVRIKINSDEKIEVALNQKAQTLEAVEEILPGNITFLDIVLPSKGSVLYAMSQIKNKALVLGVTVSNLKTGSPMEDSAGVFKTSITFDAEGEKQNVYQFLRSFSGLLPLMNLQKVGLTNSQNDTLANVSLNVYSAKFPTKIPAITESITELSSEDIKVLQELSEFEMPNFIEPSADILSEPKSDPFN